MARCSGGEPAFGLKAPRWGRTREALRQDSALGFSGQYIQFLVLLNQNIKCVILLSKLQLTLEQREFDLDGYLDFSVDLHNSNSGCPRVRWQMGIGTRGGWT